MGKSSLNLLEYSAFSKAREVNILTGVAAVDSKKYSEDPTSFNEILDKGFSLQIMNGDIPSIHISYGVKNDISFSDDLVYIYDCKRLDMLENVYEAERVILRILQAREKFQKESGIKLPLEINLKEKE